MALQPLSRPKALTVVASTLIGAVALAVVALVEPANEAVRGGLAEFGLPFGVVMLIATAAKRPAVLLLLHRTARQH